MSGFRLLSLGEGHSQAIGARRYSDRGFCLGQVEFAMTCPVGDAHGHLNRGVAEKPSEGCRFASNGMEVIVKP